ncbi:MAG TPA: hypothetical protein VHD32_09665 [Candidatus Didemnitutus sp.]|nr:hypothetical protein [Candidatus Didemnitutus sp.]
MNVRTLSVSLSASRERVFNFLADIENFPRWAPSLCERLYLSRGRWMILSSLGDATIDLEASNLTGVIDLRFDLGDRRALLPLRVVALGPETSLLMLTFVPAPEWPAGILQCDADTLARDAGALIRRFGGGEICAPEPAVMALAELGLN